ncbi:hypothetical protein MTR_1g040855 [Medicago truncatula]|uniref:Uncharacterized protein n=1 Tax=Medicago truncatula TaxID=3880 RepID=A0A072VHC7_MEDTR|nr:hypothetical protein MTR_1g040855 [Medicago truncatula]
MSSFILPTTLGEKIQKMLNWYRWGSNRQKMKARLRLETNHDTIVARVFKARYFSKWNFVDAKLGHNPSNIWHNIHASQGLARYSSHSTINIVLSV